MHLKNKDGNEVVCPDCTDSALAKHRCAYAKAEVEELADAARLALKALNYDPDYVDCGLFQDKAAEALVVALAKLGNR